MWTVWSLETAALVFGAVLALTICAAAVVVGRPAWRALDA
jgi:uncharacterized paraquat-inducible protein A